MRGRSSNFLDCGRKGVIILISVIGLQFFIILVLWVSKIGSKSSEYAPVSDDTMKNLYSAFKDESMQRNRFLLFAEQAAIEGYDVIASTFEEISNEESIHAREALKLIYGGSIPKTKENLKSAISRKEEEGFERYPQMTEFARKEGMEDVAGIFEIIYVGEQRNKEKMEKLLGDYF